jgi:hypothetical protein
MHSPNVSPFFFLVHLSQYPLVQTRHEPISAPQQPLKRPISLVGHISGRGSRLLQLVTSPF